MVGTAVLLANGNRQGTRPSTLGQPAAQPDAGVGGAPFGWPGRRRLAASRWPEWQGCGLTPDNYTNSELPLSTVPPGCGQRDRRLLLTYAGSPPGTWPRPPTGTHRFHAARRPAAADLLAGIGGWQALLRVHRKLTVTGGARPSTRTGANPPLNLTPASLGPRPVGQAGAG